MKRTFLGTPELFQFLMVRLKDEKAKPFFTYSQFQFLMVRLKALDKSTEDIYLVFQFLMVRLKEFDFILFILSNRVSIPYGTIKSMYCKYVNFKIQQVSIPYGTIKRKLQEQAAKYNNVSIPYGTIKSESFALIVATFACFNSLWYD